MTNEPRYCKTFIPMKNFLLLSVFITILAYFLPINSFTAPVPPVRTMYVPWAYNITLDGVADEYYSDLQNTEWGYPDQQESYDGESDFKADFRICMNSGCLFLLAEVTDDVEHDFDWSYESSWMFDNIEIFLQLDTNTVTTTYDGHTIQLRICRGLDSVESPGRAARSDFGYYMEAQAAGGWIAEVAIPWTAVLAEGENADHINDYMFTSIGFDLSGADSDNAFATDSIGTRDYQYQHRDAEKQDHGHLQLSKFENRALSAHSGR